MTKTWTKTEVDMSEQTLKESWTYTPTMFTAGPDDSMSSPLIYLVGCGGTGARVLGPLLKIVPANTLIYFYDSDIIEKRNLLRQNFAPEDVGRSKSEVLAERYSGIGPEVYAQNSMFGLDNLDCISSRIRDWQDTIILGCTDSIDFRKMMGKFMTKLPEGGNCLWIDAGNERFSGQVAMEGRWQGFVRDLLGSSAKPISPADGIDAYSGSCNAVNINNQAWIAQKRPYWYNGDLPDRPSLQFTGLSSNFPELVGGGVESETPRCGERFDLQTVAVNQLAATWMICLLSNFLAGKETNTVGVKFSTSGLSQPLKMKTPKIVEIVPAKIGYHETVLGIEV